MPTPHAEHDDRPLSPEANSAGELVAEIFAADGPLAAELPSYAPRAPQVIMAQTIATAIADGDHAVVEAPTGVGKSFAYLVPIAQRALATGEKIVVSTGTIALQEQLIDKDIPLLQKLFPELKAVLVKGRQNYLSRRRLARAQEAASTLFDRNDQADELQSLANWTRTTSDGDKADLGYDPPWEVWRNVVSDAGNCLGRKCPHYDRCFFYNARREIEDAHILVVNHHLYFADLALRDEHGAILPGHDIVVFDEAHNLEDVATEHLGVALSDGQVRFFLDGLWSQKGSGLLADERFAFARSSVERARAANQVMWLDVATLGIDRNEETFSLANDHGIDPTLIGDLNSVADALTECRGRAEDDNVVQECKAQADKAGTLAVSLQVILAREDQHRVYFASVPRGRGSASLSSQPVAVGPLLAERLFDAIPSVILTSATLAADDSDRFLFFRKRLGIPQATPSKRLDSPFNYQQQAQLIVNSAALDPNGPAFEKATAQWLGDYLSDAEGGAFILFTSYRQMQNVHDLLRPRLDRLGRFVLRQGDRIGRSQMIQLFKQTGNAVLFGTASFWEGVDVQGDALQHVIITKLPFEMPAHPLVEARHKLIEKAGGNPFMERSVPEAILRLKQGVGRLIRTSDDRGNVIILDHRVLTKRYGQWFLRALPPMPRETIDLAASLA